MRADHQFDWKSFRFALALIGVGFVIGILGNYSYAPVRSYLATHGNPSATLESLAEAGRAGVAEVFSSSTPQRVISSLTIADAIPQTGKFIAADLADMKLMLYQNGKKIATYTILTKGRPGTPYETPSGFYSILTKEENHLNRREQVSMPYSMQFYGNYFIHGWPSYIDGTPVASTYSGGCIRMSTADAAEIYAFADTGTSLFVYDPGEHTHTTSIALQKMSLPTVSADSYLVADIDTGDVFSERNATVAHPIASITKLMTALVANETIMFDRDIAVSPSILLHHSPQNATSSEIELRVADLLYPLLMESNNDIATTLAAYHGTSGFISWMNAEAKALDMASTTFVDASGVSPKNVSTPDDLYRLAVYLTNKKSFIWNITRTPTKTLTASNDATYTFSNFNEFSNLKNFIGGKVGHTGPAQDTMLSVFTVPVDGEMRRVAIVVLKSDDYTTDTAKLAEWITHSTQSGTASSTCLTCAVTPSYRHIDL